MNFFELVDTIRTYCVTKSYDFIYGEEQFVNALSDGLVTTSGKKIMIANFTLIPAYGSGTVVSVRYSGTISLGEKKETTTESSLDETPQQKYDRRLKALTTLLATDIGTIACDNDLEIISCNMRYDLNSFDLNADFVSATVVFEQ